MVDLGLYNYVKLALEQGKSEAEIFAELSKSTFTTEDIQQALHEVAKGAKPSQKRKLPHYIVSSILSIITLVVLGILIFLFFTKYKNLIFSLTQNYTSYSVNINVAPLVPYTEPEIGVTIGIPSDWGTVKNVPSGAEVTGFSASKNVDPFGTDNISTQVNTDKNTPALPDIITSERATVSEKNSFVLLKDEDMVIGGQPGHVFEYTYASAGKTYHEMDAYVLNSNTLYVYSAAGLSGDWSQIPALSMLKSLTFTTN